MHARGPATARSILCRERNKRATPEKNAGTDCSGVFQRNYSVLECKRDAAAHHAKVIVRPIHHVPTEIVHPADVRGDANFDAAAKLANSLGCTISVFSMKKLYRRVTNGAQSVEHDSIALAAAKNGAATGPNIGSEARTRNRITQREGPQNRTNRAGLVTRSIDEDRRSDFEIKCFPSGIHDPAFNSDAEVAVEKVFHVNTAAPGVVPFNVAIVGPIVPGEKVGAPKIDIK